MSCNEERRPTSTLPPPCCHCQPSIFYCPNYDCLPSPIKCCCPPCPPLVCRDKPKPPCRLPTLYCAKVCQPRRPCPCPSPPKINVPPSCVRYCISTTCGRSTYSPCYYSELPKHPSLSCC